MNYLVTFRNKRTNNIVLQEKIFFELEPERKQFILLSIIEILKEKEIILPSPLNTYWSYSEINNQ